MATATAPPVDVPVVRERAVYTKVQAVGLLLMAAAPALFIVASLLAGTSDGMGIFAVAVVAGVVGAVCALRLGRLGNIIGVVALLVVLSQVFWAVFGIAQPASFFDFAPGLMFFLGFLMALGGGITTLVRGKHREAQPTRGESRIIATAVVLSVAGVAVSGALTLVGRSSVDAAAAGAASPITMHDFAFSGAGLEIAADQPTQLLVHNSDAFAHDVGIAALGIEPVVVGPGSEVLLDVTAPAGDYEVLCTLHPDMAATLTAQ